jgi:Peptidase family M23
MHPLRKIVVARVLALALVTLALWQQQSATADAHTTALPARWLAPLDAPLQLVNPYFQPSSDYSAGHRGIDYRVGLGQQIYAPVGGSVWFAGQVADRNLISIRTKSGDLIEFEPACSDLEAGQPVLGGQSIAIVCDASENYRQHCDRQRCLHFSLRTTLGYLSPLVRYGELSPTILLPVI